MPERGRQPTRPPLIQTLVAEQKYEASSGAQRLIKPQSDCTKYYREVSEVPFLANI